MKLSLTLFGIALLAACAYLLMGSRGLDRQGQRLLQGTLTAAPNEATLSLESGAPASRRKPGASLPSSGVEGTRRASTSPLVERPALILSLRFAKSREPAGNLVLSVQAPRLQDAAHELSGEYTSDAAGRIELPEAPAGTYDFFLWREASVALGLRILESRRQLSPNPDGSPLEVELLVDTCERFFEVTLVPRNPEETQATIHFVCRRTEHIFRQWRPDSGPLRFGYREEEIEGEVLLWAEGQSGDFSLTLDLSALNMPSQVRLELLESAQLSLRVWESDGKPAVNRELLLSPDDGRRFLRRPQTAATDAEGRASFPHVGPGASQLGVREQNGHYATQERIELLPGERRSLELHLRPPTPLAVAGRMLDEEGDPLPYRELFIQVQGPSRPWIDSLRTDAYGDFELRMQACESILLDPNRSPRGDRFEPDRVEVPFGTQELVFRRVAQAVERNFRILALDEVSGVALGDVVPSFDLGPGTREQQDSYAANTVFQVFVQSNTRMSLGVPGYHKQVIQLESALDALEEGAPLRVAMRPGLRMRVRVLNADSEAALERVRFRSATGESFWTGADGWVSIDTDAWSDFEVSKSGFESEVCDPEAVVLWSNELIYLQPSGP